MPDFYSWQADTLVLRAYIQARASKDEIVGLHGDALKIRITAPPVDGKANSHLIKFLATLFAVPRQNVTLQKGASSRNKLFNIARPQQLPDIISR